MASSAQIVSSIHNLREPVFRSAIETLSLSSGSRGLDAGCGMGFQTLLLADAVATGGHVVGLDIAPKLLTYAHQVVGHSDLADRISLQQGDMRQLPFDSDSFDWAWSVDCAGYILLEPLSLITELVRVVRPGGYIAILAWTSEKLLPGYPILEAHLNSTSAGIAPFTRGQKAESHFMCSIGWLRGAGLEDIAVNTFVLNQTIPLFYLHPVAY